MNADILLEHFHRLGDAPDAVPRLRQFILDLAVRGKLVEQLNSDPPAADLLAAIQREKVRLAREGEITGKEAQLAPSVLEPSFGLPSTWVWVPATYPTYMVSDFGKKVQTKEVLEEGDFPVVDQGKVFIRGYCNDADKVIRVKEPIVLFGDHTRETKLIDFDFVVGADGVKLLHPICLLTAYYYLALQWLPLDSRGYGRHFKLLREAAIPLPPLPEQHRIVAKVDELMALCDRLEAAQQEREQWRTRLTAASWQALTSESDPNAARFALEQLPALTTRPQQIAALRQTILDLAVRGRLVKQDEKEGTGVEFLEEVKRLRKQLVEERRIRGGKDTEYVDAMLDTPATWATPYVADVAVVLGGKRIPKGLTFSNTPTPHIYIRVTDMKDGSIRTDGLKYVTPEVQRTIAQYTINKEDLYITIAGTIGHVGRVPEFFDGHNLTENAAKIVFRGVDPDYFRMALSTEQVQAQFTDKIKQMAQPKLAIKRVMGSKFPLPPLAEQRGIVAKVDELMRLCDALEAALVRGEEVKGRLLEAVLAGPPAAGPGGAVSKTYDEPKGEVRMAAEP